MADWLIHLTRTNETLRFPEPLMILARNSPQSRRKRVYKNRETLVMHMIKAGYPPTEIIELSGIPKSSVYNILQQHGIIARELPTHDAGGTKKQAVKRVRKQSHCEQRGPRIQQVDDRPAELRSFWELWDKGLTSIQTGQAKQAKQTEPQ